METPFCALFLRTLSLPYPIRRGQELPGCWRSRCRGLFSLRSSRYRDLSDHRAASWKELPTALGKISPPLLPLNHLKLLFLRQDYQQVVAKFHGTFRSNKLPLAL